MTALEGRLPNFLIIGAAKSGTTSLSRYLRNHSDIFMAAIEEPKYFAYRGLPPRFESPDASDILAGMTWQAHDYRRLFADWSYQKMGGEKSANYLWHPAAAQAIYEEIPDVRLITILRNPADRAFSHFTHNLRSLREPLTEFRAALDAEPERKRQNWSYNYLYRDRGHYVEHLERYFSLFPREQMLILLFDDLVADPVKVMRVVCRFLGVSDDNDLNVTERHNVSMGVPKSGLLHRALTRDSVAKSLFRAVAPISLQRRLWWSLYCQNLDPLPPFDPALRRELIEEFSDEIRRLECLIDRDLSKWLIS